MTKSDYFSITIIDPPGHGRIGDHYFHYFIFMASVRPSHKQKRATTGTMRAKMTIYWPVAWWVILNSPDLLLFVLCHIIIDHF